MTSAHPRTWIDPAVRIAAAGLGAAVGGPLGGILGSWIGSTLGASAATLVQEYAKKFGEGSAEKFLEIGADSLVSRLQESSPRIEDAYRQALQLSLAQVHSRISTNEFDDWFTNWEACLSAPVPLAISSVELKQLTQERVGDLFQDMMERLDAQGSAIRQKDISLKLRHRTIPSTLLSELIAQIPPLLEANFLTLIVSPAYEQAWKESQRILQQASETVLRRVDETTQRIERDLNVLPKIVEDTSAIRTHIADLRRYITGEIADQSVRKQRKTWRDLSHLLIPMIERLDDRSDAVFVAELFTGLDLTFRHRAFSRFTGLLRYVERNINNQTIPAYYLLCHQIDFCEIVRRSTRLLLESYWEARRQGAEAVDRLKQEQQKLTDAFNLEWNANASFDLSRQWLPLEFTVDSARRVISILPLTLSLDPAEYTSGITSTSEVLRFLASFVNTESVAYFGDATWYDDDYSLLKLWADLVDNGKIEIDRLRINAEDYEEWDYINPVVDLEIKKAEKQEKI